ncbi:MAG: hypothetical protein KZQ83_08530 [gamma proteobacterium symbiont of Taylorina sp.]|nr:hypothetical protein [gamma proteobacterium symbiont of Taylorina sp.]
MEHTQERYQVFLNNQLLKGYTLKNVLDNLSVLWKKDTETVRQILSQPYFVVKSDISIKQAKEIQLELTKAGIGSRLYKIQIAGASIGSVPDGAYVYCPKCGLQQLVSLECQNCGIIFSKYNTISSAYGQKKPLNETPQSNHLTDTWYTKSGNVFALLVIVLAAVLLLSSYKIEKEIDPSKVGIKYYDIEEVRFIDDLAEPGYVTIIELFADWCEACSQYLEREQNYIMKKNPRMAIRRIDISRNNGIDIASKHFNLNIREIPYIMVFDEDGDIIADDADEKSSGSKYVWYYE